MFAVLKTGGKQYKVRQNDVIIVEKLSAEIGDLLQFDKILMTGDKSVEVGNPLVDGAAVHAEVIDQAKSKKVVSFVKRRRKHSSQRKKGHRQRVTVLRIGNILTTGARSDGTRIEAGVSLFKPQSKGVKKLPSKAESVKDNISKSEAVKKSATKTETAKKSTPRVTKAEKLTTKPEKVNKPASAAKTTNTQAKKAKPARRSELTSDPGKVPTKKSSKTASKKSK